MDDNNGMQANDPSRLRLRRDYQINDPGKPCPACNENIPSDAVLCVHCGFDMRANSEQGPSISPVKRVSTNVFLIVSSLIACIAIALLLWQLLGSAEEETPLITRSQPYEPDQSIGTSTSEVIDTETGYEQEPLDEKIEHVEELDGMDTTNEEMQSQQMELLRTSLRDQLDAEIPLQQIGDEVALRQHDGFIYRGRILAMRGDRLALTEEGLRHTVLYEHLDSQSRLAVDRHFREEMIEQRVRTQQEVMHE